jgi:hypothetical protein
VSTASTGGSGPLSPVSNTCSPEGATQDCHRVISQHDGIVNCFYGTQTCVDGGWSECGGPFQSVAQINQTTGSSILRSPGRP